MTRSMRAMLCSLVGVLMWTVAPTCAAPAPSGSSPAAPPPVGSPSPGALPSPAGSPAPAGLPSPAGSPAPAGLPSPPPAGSTSPSGSPPAPSGPAAGPWPGDLTAAPDHTYTLEQAIRQALAHNPTLKVAERQQQEAWWAYKLGVSLPSTQVSLNYVGGNNASATSNGFAQDYNISFSQSFGTIRQIALTGKSAWQGWLIAAATVRQTRVQLVAQVKDAFYGQLIAQRQVEVAAENLALANRVLDIARKRFEAGGGPRMDLLNAQIQQAAAQQASIQAITALKQAENALQPLLGYRASETVGVEGEPALPALALVFASLEATAQELSPAVEIAQKTLEQSETQVKLARSAALPAPAVSYTYDLHTTPLYWIGATVTVPLDWGQIRYGVRQQLETVAEKRHALDSARITASNAVKTAYDNYQSALLNIETYRTTVLEPSEELMKMTQFGYQEGALPFLQVLNAEATLRQARTQYYTLLLSGHQALDALEAAVGRDFQGESRP